MDEQKSNFFKVLKQKTRTYFVRNGYSVEFFSKRNLLSYNKFFNNRMIYITFSYEGFNRFVLYIYSPLRQIMFLRTDGTLSQSTSRDDIVWVYEDDNSLCEQIDYIMGKMHSILMEIERELSFEIDFYAILNSEAIHILQENKFNYSKECSGRKNIFLSKPQIKGNTLEELVFCFVRQSEYGYDVIRFEIVETTLVICCRLLFFPETRKTMEIQVDDLLGEKGREILNLRILNTEIYLSLLKNYLSNFNDIDEWFNLNRPKNKAKVNNMGIYQ